MLRGMKNGLLLMVMSAATAGAQDPANEPEFPPLSPQDSLKATHLREGFEMELMAAEPMVVDPVAFVRLAAWPAGCGTADAPGYLCDSALPCRSPSWLTREEARAHVADGAR